jgi:predicted nucleic acid-binding protein
MTISNIAILDTNILVYAYQSLSEHHAKSRGILVKGFSKELSLCVCPQGIE